MSDVFLHLVPHSFMGEHQDGGVHFVMVEEKRNILIGYAASDLGSSSATDTTHLPRLGIFVGFASFFIMEKTLRVLGGEEEGAGHSHSHSHSHTNGSAEHANGHSTAVAAPQANGLKSRGADKPDTRNSDEKTALQDAPKQTSKLSAYLNLFGDFVHNMYVCEPLPSVSCLPISASRAGNFLCRTDGLAYVPFFRDLRHRTFARRSQSSPHAALQHGRFFLFIAAHWSDDDARLLCARNPPRDCRLLDPRAEWVHEKAGHAVPIPDGHRRLCTSFCPLVLFPPVP